MQKKFQCKNNDLQLFIIFEGSKNRIYSLFNTFQNSVIMLMEKVKFTVANNEQFYFVLSLMNNWNT